MTINSAETLVPARATVYLAPVGTAAPVDSEVAPSASWVNVGHTNPESLSMSTEPEFAEINSHQSDTAIRRFQTSESISVSVDLLQWNGANLKSAFGGGSIVEVAPAGSKQYKFTPPALGTRVEQACMIDVMDGAKKYRWIFLKTLQIEGVSAEFQKGQEARLPLRLAVLGDDAGTPWYLLSNDEALAPAA